MRLDLNKIQPSEKLLATIFGDEHLAPALTKSPLPTSTMFFSNSIRAALLLSLTPAVFAQEGPTTAQLERQIQVLFDEINDLKSADSSTNGDHFSFGGYGEYHANLPKGGDKFADPHRFVFYMGYEFADGIFLHSETELEHGFVAEDNGEISLEQLYLDIETSPTGGLQIGRMLAPLGIVNSRHEPTVMNGVERPNFSKYILPSTWSLDGFGYRSQLSDDLSASLYVTGGMDGSGFSAKDGIRGGRMNERPGIDNPAVSGRLDWRPQGLEGLRVGGSFFSGSANNSNQGGDIGVDAHVDIISLDFEFSKGDFDLRYVFAEDSITGAGALNDMFGKHVGEKMAGYYIEGAYHLLPDAWRSDRLQDSDLVAFIRYEDFDTQDELGSATLDLGSAREETTMGLGYWLTPDLVIKADYQLLDDDTGTRNNQLNFGIGWTLR